MPDLQTIMSEPQIASPPPDDELLTLQEAAAMCTVDYETFRRWVAKGAIPHVKIGPSGLMRVYRRDVAQLIRPHGR